MNNREEMNDNDTKQVILIVDDQTTNLKILSSVLSRKYSLSLANSGPNALKYLEDNKPDLILLDVMMPEMDGYEVCSIIKQNEQIKDIPVIFLTAKTDIEDVVKGFDCGAVDYITKPFNITELLVRVRNHIYLQQTRKMLKLTNDELKKLNHEKDRFFSVIAHDLRGPLAGFSQLSEMLVSEIRNNNLSMIERYALAMQQSSSVTLELLQNLMEWARSQTEELTISPSHQPLKGIVDNSIDLLLNEAKNKSITITNNINDQISIYADKEMMGVIIRNLLSNAIKFSHQGEQVTVEAKQDNKEIILSVSDNGIGMDETLISNLFRLDKNTRRKGTAKEPSSGLGLILCKEFIEKQGGRIWVESEEGKGTSVHISIPDQPA